MGIIIYKTNRNKTGELHYDETVDYKFPIYTTAKEIACEQRTLRVFIKGMLKVSVIAWV